MDGRRQRSVRRHSRAVRDLHQNLMRTPKKISFVYRNSGDREGALAAALDTYDLKLIESKVVDAWIRAIGKLPTKEEKQEFAWNALVDLDENVYISAKDMDKMGEVAGGRVSEYDFESVKLVMCRVADPWNLHFDNTDGCTVGCIQAPKLHPLTDEEVRLIHLSLRQPIGTGNYCCAARACFGDCL